MQIQVVQILFNSYFEIFHLCEFSQEPKCAYLEDPLYSKNI